MAKTIKYDFNDSQIYKQIEELINESNETMLTENANKNTKTIAVQRDLVAGISSKEYYLNKIVPSHIKNAHNNGEIHLHDLHYLLFKETNCELVDIETMLKGGCFVENTNLLEPDSVSEALLCIVKIMISVSSNTYGGCSIPYLDRALVPYIKKSFKHNFLQGLKYIENINENDIEDYKKRNDLEYSNNTLKINHPRAYKYATDLTEASVNKSINWLSYDINSIVTVNGQTPYTTIGIGTETSWEGRLVQKYILKNRMDGFGKNKETAIFPKIVYALCEGLNFDKEDYNWDITQIAFECMTKSIYPDILFVSKEDVKNGTVVYSMGCRSFLPEYRDKYGNLKYAGRFNIGATTINLPRIAIKNRGDESAFYKELDRILDICKDNCLFRAKYLEKTRAEKAPILWMHGALSEKAASETIEDLIWGGYATASIGYIGLSEVSQLIYGKDFSNDEEVFKKTFKILEYIREKLNRYSEQYNLAMTLFGTPSESLCNRFAQIDKEEFGDIEGITDKGYYDNSFHVSSRVEISIFDKLRLEALGQKYSNGGHISYIETDSLSKNLDAIYDILKYAKSVGIHYMGINQPIDKCYKCDFQGEFLATDMGFECPHCGNSDGQQMSVIRRVCGYLSQPNSRPFNKGKQKEIMGRVKHKIEYI